MEFLIKVFGDVQGVGYRYFAYKLAVNLETTGYVKNCEDGSVEILAQGEKENLEKFNGQLKRGPLFSKVKDIKIVERKTSNLYSDFKMI